jgi:hypothetical protein
MTVKAVLRRWLESHPFNGRAAIVVGMTAVAIPTAIRLSVDGVVSGTAVTGYVPFVLLSAVLLGWLNASMVAIASALIGDMLFVGRPNQVFEGPSDIFVVGLFLLVSGVLIGFVELVRRIVADDCEVEEAAEPAGIIFSLESGQAWASWRGRGTPVRLGPQTEVAEMMEDFLAQLEVAKRLSGQRTERRQSAASVVRSGISTNA